MSNVIRFSPFLTPVILFQLITGECIFVLILNVLLCRMGAKINGFKSRSNNCEDRGATVNTSIIRIFDIASLQYGMITPISFLFPVCAIMAKGVFALIGFANTSSLPTIQSYANTFHMPFVTPSALTNHTEIDQHPKRSYILHMRPLYDLAIVDIIRYYKWDKVYYMYDSNLGK